jgi:alpha-N-acetylglucosamine transferase
MRIYARNLAPSGLLDSDVILRHEVDRIFLLPDAAWARRALDRVGAFEYERSRFTCEVGRKSEDLLQFCPARLRTLSMPGPLSQHLRFVLY